MQLVDGSPEIAAVEQNDGRGDEIERGGTRLLVFLATITEATETVESDSSRQAVAGFTFVEFGGDEPAKRRISVPAEGEQRALDAADLAQRGGKGVLCR